MRKIPLFVGLHLAVGDIQASAAFYRLLGLGVPDDSSLGEHVDIDLGGALGIALSTEAITRTYDPGWRAPVGPPALALQFDVGSRDDVDRLFGVFTAAGHHGHLPPIDAFWGGRYAEVDDPDGNIVGLHSTPSSG
jgi:catechol 2,3-dioxygenase-like lactoylglutathione lyase family enzyme